MSTAEPAGEQYKLVAIEGAWRAFWSKFARTITLDASGIAWDIKGQARRRAYRDIRRIHVELRGGDLELAVCRIEFVHGPPLKVHGNLRSINGWGPPTLDPDDRARYVQFVDDLHGRLQTAGVEKVVFSAGEKAWQQALASVMLVFGSALFIVLPIGIAVWREAWQPLMAVPMGVGAASTILWLKRRNRPTTYTPDHVPRQYLP